LRIGCVKYLNARPLIHGWPGAVTLDHPSALCRKLAAGELDVALVSSFEFLRSPIYTIIDGVSISSHGPVYSVVLANRGETVLPEIELDPASQTSVALLHHLVSKRGETFRVAEMTENALSPIPAQRARLLIGDQAIRFRQKFGQAYHYWDLGQEWTRLTQLPFVYALWLVRPETGEPGRVGRQLRALRDANLGAIDEIIAQEREFAPEFCRRYYTDNLRFSFGAHEKEGLEKFADACTTLNLVSKQERALRLA
jgi:chorismate dehydratase